MKGKSSIFKPVHIFSSLFMIVTLLWLTVSTPFVFADQQLKKDASEKQNKSGNSNPFSNTTEEKNETGVNTLSEYLHDTPQLEQFSLILVTYYKCHPSRLYFAFHPELISPPPEA
jgi:hypothetical protein